MCCGFWESKLFSLLEKREEETLTLLVAGGVVGGDVWKCCSCSAAIREEGGWEPLGAQFRH